MSLVQEYLAQGGTGIERKKAERLQSMYLVGYSCEDIAQDFPEHSVGEVLWARAFFGWDEQREHYQSALAKSVSQVVKTAKADGLKFLAEVTRATQVKWRADLLRYLSSPDTEQPPEFLPKTLNGYGSLVSLITELAGEKPAAAKGGAFEKAPPASPLVTVNINTKGKKQEKDIEAEVVTSSAKSSLMSRLKAKKE